MIIDNYNDVDISEADVKGHDFTFDSESQGMMARALSDTLYSNKIGSIVREITSNSFDAQAEAKVKRDVIITIQDPGVITDEPGKISFRDFGVGISPERVENVYSKYFASTKRDSNDQIGGFGLGSKTPWSYTEFFEVHTWVDGMYYQYIMHRGVSIPRIDLVETYESNEPQGTEIIIPIKNYSDAGKFRTELKKQLKYFDNVVFKGDCQMEDDYRIIQGKNFLVRTDEREVHREIEICVGKVAYPFDKNLLNDPDEPYYNLVTPIALRFEVGEIPVAVSRESIEYTDETIKAIRQKLEDAMDEMEAIKLKALEDEEDLNTYVSSALANNVIILEGELYRLPKLKYNDDTRVRRWTFKPFKGLDMISMRTDYFSTLFHVKAYIKNGETDKTRKYTDRSTESLMAEPEGMVYRSKAPMSEKKSMYISDTYDSSFYVVGMKPNALQSEDLQKRLRNDSVWLKYRKDHGIDKAAEEFDRQYRIYLKYLVKYFVANSKSYDDVEVSDEWSEEYEANKVRPDKDKDVFTVRWSSGYARTFHMNRVNLKEVYDEWSRTKFLIYGFQGEEDDLDRVKRLFEYKAGYPGDFKHDSFVKVFKISKDNARRKLKYFDGAMHWSSFKESMIQKQIDKHNLANDSLKDILSTAEAVFNWNGNRDKYVPLYGKEINKYIQIAHNLSYRGYRTVGKRTKYDGKEFRHQFVVSKDTLGNPIIWDFKNNVNMNELAEQFREWAKTTTDFMEFMHHVEPQYMQPKGKALFEKVMRSQIKPFKFKQ